jgi:hypothetical protein
LEFKLHYYVQDNGDGSASVRFTASEKDAENHPDAEEGWGESTASYIDVKVEKKKIFIREFRYNPETGKHGYEWIEVQQS